MHRPEAFTRFLPMPCGAEIGFEKEYVLRARSKETGALYNLNLAQELVATAAASVAPHALVEEYSRCLVEVVSKPYPLVAAQAGLRALSGTKDTLTNELQRLVRDTWPKLAERYDVFVEDDGCSPTNEYLDPDLRTFNDQEDPAVLVLPAHRPFVEAHREHVWQVGNAAERLIGTYGTVQSFHFTFHPSYDATGGYERYLEALSTVGAAVERYSFSDTGSRSLTRAGAAIEFDEPVRDAFLRTLLASRNIVQDGIYIKPELFIDTGSYFEGLTARLMSATGSESVDEAYKKWSALDMRPRIINDALPAIEVRRFSSGYSSSISAQNLIREIIESDASAI